MADGKPAKWSEVPDDIWILILSKLKGKDRVRSKAVCPRWLKVVESLAPSMLPWLVLPPAWNQDQDGLCFYSHEDEFYHMKNMPEELSHGLCLGSCYGWMLYLIDDLELMLLNPFSWNQIPLPSMLSFPNIRRVKDGKYDEILFTAPRVSFGWRIFHDSTVTARSFKSVMRTKVVLSSRPTCRTNKEIGVVAMYTFGVDYDFLELRYCNLAFCTTAAEDSKWTKLNDEYKWYLGIMSHEEQFYALRQDFSVEVWDFPNGSFPIQRRVIQADSALVPPRRKSENEFIYNDYWIVKAREEILLLVLNKASRFEQRPESILVYKLDSGENWTKVESIGNHALLLGFNQPILIPGQGNQDFNPKGSVYVITRVSYRSREIKGFRYSASVFNLGENSLKRLKEVSEVGTHFDLGDPQDPAFYWVEAPF